VTQTPSPSVSIAPNQEIIEKLNLIVEGENAAVWAFGYLLSFIPEENKDYATSVFNIHRDQRDIFRLKLRNLNQVPPRPKENYQLPFEVKDIVTAYELAVFIENRLIGIYLQLFKVIQPENRKEILDFVLKSSIRLLEFKDRPRALPGSIN
jgi:hypothetical protein